VVCLAEAITADEVDATCALAFSSQTARKEARDDDDGGGGDGEDGNDKEERQRAGGRDST
jgi:hypothetical protein